MNQRKNRPGSGIVRSRNLQGRGLASYAVRIAGGHAGGPNCAVDPNAPEHVAHDAACIKGKGTVQLCENIDAWGLSARRHDLGRRCLEAILQKSALPVRILTERAEVRQDFDLIERYRDRVLLGMPMGGSSDQAEMLRVIRPNASPIEERVAAMDEAAERGLRTYAVFSPLLPGIGAAPRALFQMLRSAEKWGAEEVLAEPPDPRGTELQIWSEALASAGFHKESEAVGRMQDRAAWSRYVAQLWAVFRPHACRFFGPERLRFFVYPSGLNDDDLASVWLSAAGVVWLGRSAKRRRIPARAVEGAFLRNQAPMRGQGPMVTVWGSPTDRESVTY